MSKLNNFSAKRELSCFRDAFGNSFDKLCNDVQANVGRLEKDIVSKASGWTVGTKGKIVSKEGHALQLPLNSPWASLLLYGMQLTKIADNGSTDEPKYIMNIQADIPAVCKSWFDKFQEDFAKSAKSEVVTA